LNEVCIDGTFADTLDMNLFRLAKLSTVLALCDRPTLFLHFEERSIVVLAGG
jgi:hypothetical protein